MSSILRVTRTYTSTRTGELTDAMPADRWDAMVARITSDYAPTSITPYTDGRTSGIDVELSGKYAPRGTSELHAVVCGYGAPTHILV